MQIRGKTLNQKILLFIFNKNNLIYSILGLNQSLNQYVLAKRFMLLISFFFTNKYRLIHLIASLFLFFTIPNFLVQPILLAFFPFSLFFLLMPSLKKLKK